MIKVEAGVERATGSTPAGGLSAPAVALAGGCGGCGGGDDSSGVDRDEAREMHVAAGGLA
jgi:hypothetical protein